MNKPLELLAQLGHIFGRRLEVLDLEPVLAAPFWTVVASLAVR